MTAWPKALVIAAWIGSILNGLLAALGLLWSAYSGGWPIYIYAAWSALGCLLLLPPLWTKRSKIIAYARPAAGVMLLIGGLFMLIKTHAVKLVMPSNSAMSK